MKVGILFRREINLTYARIQDIHLRSGIIQRWLGLANVEVQSAGGGGSDAHGTASSGHVAEFEGVDNAEVIRDLIVERLRVYRDSGLGEKTLSSFETGERITSMKLAQLLALLAVYDVTPAEFFDLPREWPGPEHALRVRESSLSSPVANTTDDPPRRAGG